VVFSDDIGMAAAESAGGVAARIHAHYDAGCDSVLVCAPGLVPDALAAMDARAVDASALHALLGRPALDWDALAGEPRWREARATLGIEA
jgi:beta-N-acetylhexosaminidase